jgi:hypothetical protein
MKIVLAIVFFMLALPLQAQTFVKSTLPINAATVLQQVTAHGTVNNSVLLLGKFTQAPLTLPIPSITMIAFVAVSIVMMLFIGNEQRRVRTGILAAGIMLLGACGGGSSPATKPGPPTPVTTPGTAGRDLHDPDFCGRISGNRECSTNDSVGFDSEGRKWLIQPIRLVLSWNLGFSCSIKLVMTSSNSNFWSIPTASLTAFAR